MVKKIKGATRKNFDVDGTCKRDQSCKRETWFITTATPIPKKNQVTWEGTFSNSILYRSTILPVAGILIGFNLTMVV